jgi:hypothetical protein
LAKLLEAWETKEILNPPQMLTSLLYDPKVFHSLLDRCQGGELAQAPVLRRIITLELVARALRGQDRRA